MSITKLQKINAIVGATNEQTNENKVQGKTKQSFCIKTKQTKRLIII